VFFLIINEFTPEHGHVLKLSLIGFIVSWQIVGRDVDVVDGTFGDFELLGVGKV
jgi:hypothetical protein